METRKETLNAMKVCRFCLATDENLIPLYDNKVRAPKNSVPFALKILACIAIEIFPSDNMPQYICQRCKLFMELSYAFKQLCRQTDEAILQYIQNGTPLLPMPWPTQLNKVYKATNKSAEANVVKTVVQGGATVKVMAEEVSDSEEGEDDNVYNVKIGDGSEEGKSIKIITSIDKQDQGTKRGRQGIGKNFEDADNPEMNNIEAGCWACDECECTYPLEQLLSLHKAQKHRVRNETCEDCGGKFFTKYDLMTHQLTHNSEMPFQCVACGKKFKRLILLKRHEKIMHAELPQQSCLNCPATFLSVEELEVHQQRHERHTERPFKCYICDKRFHDKAILQRHTGIVHNKKPAFSCQYCPEQFPSVSKLTRHVREHAGVRPYPCKHCDKSFTKSHHYTRHLRLKHSTTIRTAGTYNESDAYRCDECEDTFATQDELMYHSALHATRNLICPLCQEKFDDVDTVTTHIKSHVNGSEFMCDFCELIFTTKEKLENHIARAHDDELLANEQETENDESSMDMDAEEDDDENSINVKEEDGHMVVEIKKAGEYMLPTTRRDEEDKTDNTQSEDSDVTYTDSPVTELEAMPTPKQRGVAIGKDVTITKMSEVALKQSSPLMIMRPSEIMDIHPAHILRKAEEIKRKAVAVQQQQLSAPAADKKEKIKVESSAAATGANDKSLRLLEKELQDLKRTNTRPESGKAPVRTAESLRNRRPQLFSSTPKIRSVEKKEVLVAKPAPEKVVVTKPAPEKVVTKPAPEKVVTKPAPEKVVTKPAPEKVVTKPAPEKVVSAEKKQVERKVTKDPKESREAKSNNITIKEEKDVKGNVREDKEVIKEEKKEVKEKEPPKAVIKNGASEAATAANEDPVRRSTRPSKFKDYAKMIRDSSLNSDENDSDSDDEVEEYREPEKSPETSRVRGRRSSNKPTATSAKAAPAAKPAASAKTPTPAAAAAPRKRGRPRKEQPQTVVPSKIKKDEPSEEETEAESVKSEVATPRPSPPKEDVPKENEPDNIREGTKTPEANKLLPEPKPGVIMSPSGQTLKKVPIKALPPGVKPLPLPVNSRLGGGEVCEMQIGKKMVKVQKIVMTKAEVEAMAKKGLVEMKDGTMVLKQGIKLPAADPAALKSSLVGVGEQKKESLTKHDKPAPSRCDLDA